MKKRNIKFNFIDVLIVLVIILVLIVGWMFVNNRGTNAASVEFTYDILFKEVPQEFADSIKTGAAVFDGVKIIDIGTVQDFSEKEASRYEFSSQSGEYVETKIPEKYDVTMKVHANGNRSDLAYFVNEYEIYVGKTADVKSTGVVGHGVIVAVDEVE